MMRYGERETHRIKKHTEKKKKKEMMMMMMMMQDNPSVWNRTDDKYNKITMMMAVRGGEAKKTGRGRA